MVKIRVEDTYTNKVFETECDGAIISTYQRKENDCTLHSVISGSFNVELLKRMYKNIKKNIKELLKGRRKN